jgi:hypothetical protein
MGVVGAHGIGLGVLGVDLPLDIRDLSHTLTHREWSYKWGETLAYNTIGLIPLIGVIKNLKNAKKLKYLDDAGELAKRSDDASDAAGDAGRRAPPASDPPSQPPSKAPSGPQEPRGPLFIGTPNGRVFRIPEGWVGRPADNGKGIVFQRPGADGNSELFGSWIRHPINRVAIFAITIATASHSIRSGNRAGNPQLTFQ